MKTPEGEIRLDGSGRENGRGAYLCDDFECLKMARAKKALSRSFRTDVKDAIYEELEREWHDRKE